MFEVRGLMARHFLFFQEKWFKGPKLQIPVLKPRTFSQSRRHCARQSQMYC
jgi:hypothetical protein